MTEINAAKKIKILIIDDERTTRSAISRILLKTDHAFVFDEADNARAGLTMIENNSYDCVILDYLLGDMSGLDFLSRMVELGMPAPVIMLTSHGDEMLAVKPIKSGACDYLSKTILSRPDFSEIMSAAILNSITQFNLDRDRKSALNALEMSEERYRNLIENSDILIIRFFAEERIVSFVNTAFCRYFNVRRQDILGETFMKFIPSEEHQRVNAILESLGHDTIRGQHELRTGAGLGERWQIWNYHAIVDSSGETIEFQCMGEDITDLKLTQLKLSDMLSKVQEMKKNQDGDYFLTSLLLDQLSGNFARSDLLSIKTVTVQKKKFTFRKWVKEIGGDICYTRNVSLRGSPGVLFLNADAMGKSIQGAGGALVLGAVMQSIISRIKFSSFEQSLYPEQFIRNTFQELQRVFESFNGSMMVSMVLGLIDEKTGMMYYINSEHPWTVLYRNGSASFIEDRLTLRKLGVDPAYSDEFRVKTFKMLPGDVIITGSDGRDDFLVHDGRGGSVLNEDERLFLSLVDEARGDVDSIRQLILSLGELTDDLSMIGITRIDQEPGPAALSAELDAIMGEVKKLEESGDIEGALERCIQGRELDQRCAPLVKRHGRLLLRLKSYAEAIPVLRAYAEMHPEETVALFHYSVALRRNGMVKKSAEIAERIILREPENITYLHWPGCSLR
jgi:PAS domain S-box-containing protein